MKKSEMVSKLSKLLLDNLNLDMENDDVEYIVNQCERLGMSPPKTSVEDPNYFYNVDRNKWDSEND